MWPSTTPLRSAHPYVSYSYLPSGLKEQCPQGLDGVCCSLVSQLSSYRPLTVSAPPGPHTITAWLQGLPGTWPLSPSTPLPRPLHALLTCAVLACVYVWLH